MQHFRWLVMITLTAISLASCASRAVVQPEPPPSLLDIRVVTLNTESVVVEAADGSFRIDSDGVFETPFRVTECPSNPTTDDLAEVLAAGGQRVTIEYPSMSQPLHGVLAFCPLTDDVTGPASRSYLLQVPQSYVNATSDNRVSVVYEAVNTVAAACSDSCRFARDGECDDGGPGSLYSVCDFGTDCSDCGSRAGGRGSTAAWVLFLSQIPL